MERTAVRILVVDDDAGVRTALKGLFAAPRFEVDLAIDGVSALERITELPPDLVLTDLDMPRMNGMQLLEKLHERHKDLPVIVLTSNTELTAAVAAMRAGAAD